MRFLWISSVSKLSKGYMTLLNVIRVISTTSFFQRLNKKFYPSNIFPVWVNASTQQQNDKFLQYLEKANVTNFLR